MSEQRVKTVNFDVYTLLGETHLQVRPVDGFSHLMAQTTPSEARMRFSRVSLIGLLLPSNIQNCYTHTNLNALRHQQRKRQSNITVITSLRHGAEYLLMTMSLLCLFVCPNARMIKYPTTNLQLFLWILYLWPWLDHHVMALWYVKYLR